MVFMHEITKKWYNKCWNQTWVDNQATFVGEVKAVIIILKLEKH